MARPDLIDLAVAEALDPVLLVREQLRVEPDPWQSEALRAILVERAPRVLMNASRQSGKTWTMATAGLLEAMSSDATVLLVSPSLRQSQEAFKAAIRSYRRLERRPVEPVAESALRIEFESGGRLVAVPGGEGETIRGYTVDLLLIDEAARVNEDLYFSVRPMVAVSRGRIIAASTPNGARGWWYGAWRGSEPWHRFEIPAVECPRLTPDILRAEREALGPHFYEQEYECRFHTTGISSWFDRAEFERAYTEEEPWL